MNPPSFFIGILVPRNLRKFTGRILPASFLPRGTDDALLSFTRVPRLVAPRPALHGARGRSDSRLHGRVRQGRARVGTEVPGDPRPRAPARGDAPAQRASAP